MSLQSTINQGIAIAGGIHAIKERKSAALQSQKMKKEIAQLRHDVQMQKLANQRAKIEQEFKKKQREEFIQRMKLGKAKAAAARARTTAEEQKNNG